MLRMNEKVTINGASVIDEKDVCGFSALIDSDNPENIIVNQRQIDKDAYREHREECRKDFAEFEDCAYKRQKEMLDALKK